MKPATCHPDRQHFAKGMCSICYQRAHRKTHTPKTRATCHPDRAHRCKGLCNACYQAYKASPDFRPTGRAKTANVCGHTDRRHVGHGLCSACFTKARRDANREEDRAKRKDYQLRVNYGLTLGEFHALYRAQGNACALCRKQVPAERDRHVDHCHATGMVRGILCFSCNKGLGLLGDDTAGLARALAYVSRDTSARRAA